MFELLALAARLEMEEAPEKFGICEDYPKLESRFESLKQRRVELQDQLERSAWDGSDVTIEPHSSVTLNERDRGLVRAFYKITDGAIPIGSGAGECIIDWAIANDWVPTGAGARL